MHRAVIMESRNCSGDCAASIEVSGRARVDLPSYRESRRGHTYISFIILRAASVSPAPFGTHPTSPRRRRQCVRKLLSKEAGIEERKLHRLSHNTLHLQVVRARPNGGGKRKSESRYDA